MNPDLIGWTSAFILILTLGRQAYTQYRTRSIAGVSKWLFVGQLSASIGFTVYSWMLNNWVFVSVNFAIFITAVVGELIYLRNRKLVQREQEAAGERAGTQAGKSAGTRAEPRSAAR